jgi:RNA polymerase sigma-70 factor (ECF subfamily)
VTGPNNPKDAMTDHELLLAFAERSDAECLGVFMGRHEERLLRFAGRLLGDVNGAQDVVQEAFIQVACHPRKLLTVESCANWLFRVTRNIGISHLRRQSRHDRRARIRAEEATRELEVRAESERTALEADEERHLVRNEIERSSPRHRELLHLKIVEEKSYREIAEITGLTVTNVGYQLHIAVKDLSRRLRARREAGP